MKRRFSKQELFVLRNHIPIKTLIANILPYKFIEGSFRFLCPKCNESQTSTMNRKTNLARCFRCELNFNTIEIVQYAKGLNFVESVNYLKKHYETLLKRTTPWEQPDILPQNTCQNYEKTISIGSTLKTVLPEPLKIDQSKYIKPTPTPTKHSARTDQQEELIQRIENLEQQVRNLCHKFEKLTASTD